MITGEKVILRAIELSDVKQLWEWTQDAEVMRYRDYPYPPQPLAEAEREYQDSLCRDTRDLHLAITTLDGELIGETSLRYVDHRGGNADFTIAIGNKAYWSHGYGSDATKALMKFAFEQYNLHRITLYVHAFNERAIRAYERCGFRHEGRLRESHYLDGEYKDVLVMGLLKEEFERLEWEVRTEERVPAHA
ncbi:MAG TPA: GNAT family protein [Armatimonadota bacterium]|nr:GNAT family protein [Armatimonadota bacterium]